MDRWKNRNLLNRRDAFVLRRELELTRKQMERNQEETAHKLAEMQEILEKLKEQVAAVEKLQKAVLINDLINEVEKEKSDDACASE